MWHERAGRTHISHDGQVEEVADEGQLSQEVEDDGEEVAALAVREGVSLM